MAHLSIMATMHSLKVQMLLNKILQFYFHSLRVINLRTDKNYKVGLLPYKICLDNVGMQNTVVVYAIRKHTFHLKSQK